MKFATFIALVATLFAQQGEAEYIEDRRILSSEIVPRSFIVQAKGDSCGELQNKIDLLKKSIDGPSTFMREPAARRFAFPTKCFCTFMGSDTVKLEVEKLEEVELVEPNLQVQTAITWGLDRVDQATLPLDGADWKGSPSGNGVTVYVIDTGVLATHSEFNNGNRASLAFDAVGESGLDGNGHGTHCAGTVGGKTYGVAREATIKGIKVLSASGSGTNAGVLEGINWAVNDSPNEAAVLSMSLGGGSSAAIDNAVNAAADAGNIVVVAAGNDNRNACSYSPAGAGGNGRNGGVITVASTTSSDSRSSFSNYGSCTDIFAPGSSITSAWNNGGTNTISGTSMACPHVAGIAAVLLEKHCGDKDAAVAELFDLASENQISDDRGTPNLLAQVPTSGAGECNGGGDDDDDDDDDVGEPTTPPPAGDDDDDDDDDDNREWTCPNSWFGAGDGCDCECGGGDPDCDAPYENLYCNGEPANWWTRCNLITDECVPFWSLNAAETLASGRSLDLPPSKTETASESAASLAVPIAGGLVAFAALVVVGAVVVRRRRASNEVQSGSVVTSKNETINPQFDL